VTSSAMGALVDMDISMFSSMACRFVVILSF
jgi:hypothetical protein